MKALCMKWWIVSHSFLLWPKMNLRNFYSIYEDSSTIKGSILSSGLYAIFVIFYSLFIISFVKLWEFYDKNGGISVKDYCKIIINKTLRLTPVYFTVFFFGWAILPLMSSSSLWYITGEFFEECSTQWPYVMTLTSSLFPYFNGSFLNGCFQWAFLYSNIFLVYLFLPLFVIIYKKNSKIFTYLVIFTLFFGVFVNILVVRMHDLRVGKNAPNDYLLYSLFIIKPYTKIVPLALSMLTGLLYFKIEEYKKVSFIKLTFYSYNTFRSKINMIN